MVDYFLRKGQYDRAGLVQKIGGLYWRNGGINWKAIIALVVGMVAALMCTHALYYFPSYQGPLSNSTGGGATPAAPRHGRGRGHLLGSLLPQHSRKRSRKRRRPSRRQR